ncbi:MAG TPA: helix-turn-helix transcriptional regulator [Candidatus Gastranaerophilaceae bacterium]|nr:helix-turn-helix transcriptional regulator [Candidatus Gastranaerophilaceae bacterium]HPT40826.1 helix-turn-helix transcriptional regulator [Candidatus Gastranaerophilaceae bacterium]
MQHYKNISSYIKQRRLETGISLNEFAFNNDLEPATLSRYENGKRTISLMNMVKIANGFNQTLAEFLADFEKKYFK